MSGCRHNKKKYCVSAAPGPLSPLWGKGTREDPSAIFPVPTSADGHRKEERACKFILYKSDIIVRYIFVLCSNKNKVRWENRV
jgi:hypothetical protein